MRGNKVHIYIDGEYTLTLYDDYWYRLGYEQNREITEEELAYLSNIKWFKTSYINFLRLWQPRFEDFTITTDAECDLSIETDGSWLNTSMYEIPTLAIVNEVWFRMNYNYEDRIKRVSYKNSYNSNQI